MAPITIHTDASVLQVQNNAATTLSAGINATQTTIPLTNTSKFASAGGYAVIAETSASPVNEEVISYTGKTGSDLTGVTRGVDGSTAMNGNLGDAVEVRDFAQHHNAVADAVKVTSQDLADIASGTEAFSTFSQQSAGAGSPSYTSDFQITGTTEGDTQLAFDLSADDSRLQIGRDEVEANQFVIIGRDLDEATTSVEFAGKLMVYTNGNMQTSAQMGVKLDAGLADGGGVIPFIFKTINDIDSGDWNFVVQNQSSVIMGVRKNNVQVPKITATMSPGLNLVVFSADPTTPSNGDVWLYENGGTREIRVRMSGVNRGVAVT